MGAYTVVHQTPAGTNLTMINITGSASVRIKLYEVIIGSDAVPEDDATEFGIGRTSSVGTGGTALNETPVDPLMVAASGVALGGTFTGQPTWADSLLMIALNQRATFRWMAAPGGELISTASANNGMACRTVNSTDINNQNVTMCWEE